jgi:hypothetical protein
MRTQQTCIRVREFRQKRTHKARKEVFMRRSARLKHRAIKAQHLDPSHASTGIDRRRGFRGSKLSVPSALPTLFHECEYLTIMNQIVLYRNDRMRI